MRLAIIITIIIIILTILIDYWEKSHVIITIAQYTKLNSVHGSRAGISRATVRAGHLRYFLIFEMIIEMTFCIFYQVYLTESGLFKWDWCRNKL